jgi:NADP-reducing hydrogenase subunit HndB
MSKIKPEDLDRIGKDIKRTMLLREGSCRIKIIVHMGTCGIAAGARNVMKALTEEIEKADAGDVQLTISSCAGLCSHEPMITIEQKDQPAVKYVDLNADKAREIFSGHVLGGKIMSEYALAAGSERTL